MTPDEGEEARSEDPTPEPVGDSAETSEDSGPGAAVEPEAAGAAVEPEGAGAGRSRKSSRWRHALVAVLLVLSCLTVLVSSVSI